MLKFAIQWVPNTSVSVSGYVEEGTVINIFDDWYQMRNQFIFLMNRTIKCFNINEGMYFVWEYSLKLEGHRYQGYTLMIPQNFITKMDTQMGVVC